MTHGSMRQPHLQAPVPPNEPARPVWHPHSRVREIVSRGETAGQGLSRVGTWSESSRGGPVPPWMGRGVQIEAHEGCSGQ